MKKRISDLMDCIHDADYELNQETPLSSQRIKELTMNKITNKRKSRHIGFRVLVAAAVIAALTITAAATSEILGAGEWFLNILNIQMFLKTFLLNSKMEKS